MEYIKCNSCGKPIASYDKDTRTINLHVQCKSCKTFNVITSNSVIDTYLKIGKINNKSKSR